MNYDIKETYERDKLVLEKTELSKKLNATPKSDPERAALASRYLEIETQLTKLKSIRRQRPMEYREEDLVKSLIDDVFGIEYRKRFFIEIDRRRLGEKPMMVSPIKKASLKDYKKELSQAYQLMLDARKLINSYIDKNEPEINKADYLKSVSVLSNCLPTVSEIEKLKRVLEQPVTHS